MSRLASFLALTAALATSVAPAAAAPVPCNTRTERVAGGTWETRPVEGVHGPLDASVAVDEHDPRFVVVGDHSGALVTKDAGCTWRRAAEYSDFLFPFAGYTIDAAVAGTGRDRTLHVLVAPLIPFTGFGQPVLLSSADDGATWSSMDVPVGSGPASSVSYALASGPRSPEALHLLTVTSTPAAAVYAQRANEWEWHYLGLWAQTGTCVPDGPCTGRVLHTLHADQRRDGALWGLAAGPDAGEAIAWSGDEGVSWDYRDVPGLNGGVDEVEVTPGGRVLLLGPFGDYALSRDGGRSWAVGDYPEIASSSGVTIGVTAAAHFDRGHAFAAVLGSSQASEQRRNVVVFDGRRWTNVSPPAGGGSGRTEFVQLAGSRGPLVALTSAGDLMTYRR